MRLVAMFMSRTTGNHSEVELFWLNIYFLDCRNAFAELSPSRNHCESSDDCDDCEVCNFDYFIDGFCEVCQGNTYQDCIDSGFHEYRGTRECLRICAGEDVSNSGGFK